MNYELYLDTDYYPIGEVPTSVELAVFMAEMSVEGNG